MRRVPAICLITHARFPLGEPRAERAARAARSAGYHVDVIALRGHGEPAREQLDGTTVWRMPVTHRRGAPRAAMMLEYLCFALLASLWALALHIRRQFRVVEVHAPPEFLVLAGLLPKLLGAGLVLDIRDLSSHLWEARFGSSRESLVVSVLERVERVSCAVADAVVTVHDPYRAQLVARGVKDERITVVMNAPDESMITRVRRVSGPRQRAPFTVAYHGTITRWYGVDILIAAIGLLSEAGRRLQAVVLGEGDQLGEVRALAASLGVSDCVFFSNRYLPIEQALGAIADADCGVIPNRPTELNRYILPNKLFEYVALGIPVISTKLETVSAHFGEDELTFCELEDPASLAAAVEWVMDQQALALQKSARAQARASLYSWSVNRASYLRLLDEVQGRRVGQHV